MRFLLQTPARLPGISIAHLLDVLHGRLERSVLCFAGFLHVLSSRTLRCFAFSSRRFHLGRRLRGAALDGVPRLQRPPLASQAPASSSCPSPAFCASIRPRRLTQLDLETVRIVREARQHARKPPVHPDLLHSPHTFFWASLKIGVTSGSIVIG